jgi:hypothetical protein
MLVQSRSQGIVNVADALRLRDCIDVIQVREEVLAFTQLRLDALQGTMDSQREEQGHQRIALLATLTLLHKVLPAGIVQPGVARRLGVRKPHEREHGTRTRQLV